MNCSCRTQRSNFFRHDCDTIVTKMTFKREFVGHTTCSWTKPVVGACALKCLVAKFMFPQAW